MEISNFWVYFAARPLFWIVVTLIAFLVATWINRKAGGTALLHPVFVSMLMIIGLLVLTKTDYNTYFEGAQFIHFLLGPATVALAIPLYDHLARIRRLLLPILMTCIVGSVFAAATALAVGIAMDGDTRLLLSLAPKSVTSPIAIGISEQIGGYPSLSAGLALLTGIIGCLAAPLIFKLLKLKSETAMGFSLGLSAHGFGTAQSFSLSNLAGAFAGLAMGVTGLLSAFLIPLLVRLF